MAKIRYSSWGGALQRTLHVDDGNRRQLVQETTIEYPDNFAQMNLDLGEQQTGNMKLIARGVPAFVWEQSEREGWDEKRWAQWLNDPDNAAFRVWRGTV